MKGIRFGSNYSTATALAIALSIVAWIGESNHRASAFCSRSIVPRNFVSMAAGRNSDRNEWISYLEEEFRRSGKIDSGNNDDGNKFPEEPPKPFQTSVETITNAMDLLDSIETAPPNDLTIVLFFAHYCKTCQRAFAPYKQLANTATQGIRFVRFETSGLMPKQFRGLGIDRVPFLQIYRNGICVSSFSAVQKISTTSSKIVLKQRLLEQIDACQRRSLSDWSAFRKQHDREIEANKAARAMVREALTTPQNADDTTENDGKNEDDDDEERLYRSVQTLTSETELLRLLQHGEKQSKGDNGMVAIMFHSHFDPSCVRAQHKFRKIAMERQKQQSTGNTSFTMARIEASILSDTTLESLGVQKYPHIQIYRESSRATEAKQCVASFSIPRSFLFAKLLHESLDAIDQRTPEEWTAFYDRHKNDIESQQVALETILRDGRDQ